MTVEDAVIALLAVVAGILLFIGLAQALDSAAPRTGRRRSRSIEDDPDRGPDHVTVPVWSRALEADDTVSVPTSSVEPPPRAAELPEPAPAPGATLAETWPEQLDLETALAPAPAEHPPVGAADTPAVPVEICARLLLADQYEDVIAAAELAGFGHQAASPEAAHEQTALCSLVALSRQALGDDQGVEAAVAAALAHLPSVVEHECPQGVAAMSVPIARRLLDWSGRFPEGAKEHIVGPRLAAFWLRWRLIGGQGDDDTQALLDSAGAAVAEAHARAASELTEHQQWREAARVVEQARVRGELPERRGELLLEALGASVRHEVDRLTAPIVRGAKNEGRAVAGLERAESTLAAVRDLDLPARHRLAMVRRVWLGYAKLGMARLHAGNLDAATEALLHALGMREIGRRRQRHVREAVVKALETSGDEKVDHIVKLLAEGDRTTAVERVDGFLALVQRARERGVPDKDLGVASTKARLLAQLIEPAR
jgi:hypothetical protein